MLILLWLPVFLLPIVADAEFFSLVQYANNCTVSEYSYGTRCTCTWTYVCESSTCTWITSPCKSKDLPFCVDGGESHAKCTAIKTMSTTNLNTCVPNQMIVSNPGCLCNGQICPKSVFTVEPTFELIVLNYCSTAEECIRNDYASYTVFPFNGGITGADPQYNPVTLANPDYVHVGGGVDGDS